MQKPSAYPFACGVCVRGTNPVAAGVGTYGNRLNALQGSGGGVALDTNGAICLLDASAINADGEAGSFASAFASPAGH